MQIKTIAKVIGKNSAIGLIGFIYGDTGKIQFAQQLDSERLLSAVRSEANGEMRLKKASALIAVLKTTRAKYFKNAQDLAKKDPESPVLKTYAANLANLDENIADAQKILDELTIGQANASRMVDRIQAEVTANLIDDELTLTNKAINEIMSQQVVFMQGMVDALPNDNIADDLRESVVKDVEEEKARQESMVSILTRLIKNQGDALESTDSLSEAGEAVLNEILGKK